MVFRFRIQVFGYDFGFSDSRFRFSGPILGFPIQDSGFWIQFLVSGFRIQVFGSGFGFSDSGFRFWGPILGFPIQDSGFWIQVWVV